MQAQTPCGGGQAPARDRVFKAGPLLAAACALPGIAAAQSAPTQGEIGFKYLFYKDLQPGLDRITVNSPSVYGMMPVGSNWSIEGAFVVDVLSGATPRYHTAVSGASKMDEERTAADFKVVRYFRRAAVGVGVAASNEHDYESRAFNMDMRLSTDDNNTTFALGYGRTEDDITPTGGGFSNNVFNERKESYDYLLGVTRVLSPNDIAKINFTETRGRGYFSDPYKRVDARPRTRNQQAWLFQWNHHFAGSGDVLRTSYRYYSDTFEVKAHTVGFEYAKQTGQSWTITPALRYHTQSAAYFYFDPNYDIVAGVPYPAGYSARPWVYSSADQRLSAFGGVTVGLKAAKTFTRWTFDVRYDYLQQRGDWRLGGEGSPGLDPFIAHMIQFGWSRPF